jgi:phosphoribosylamine---glycine ligase
MKVMIVGGGGREHALAWKFRRDDSNVEIIAAPGNPGIAALGQCFPIATDKLKDLAHLAEEERVDFTVVGPETPLEAGIVNLFQTRGLPVFGPTREAARIETSKRFAKELMVRAGIPTARASQHADAKEAKAALADFGSPVVIKASGLAAGKAGIAVPGRAGSQAPSRWRLRPEHRWNGRLRSDVDRNSRAGLDRNVDDHQTDPCRIA